MQSLDIISVNIWQILISLCNLTLIFLIVKKFFFAPVRKVLAERQSKIDADYEAARVAAEQAQADKEEWESQLNDARAQAEEIIKSATVDATQRSDTMLAQAKTQADAIVRRAEEDAVLSHQKAQAQIKHEIADVSVLLAKKMLDREINSDDHRELIDAVIDTIGDDNDTDI